MKINSTLNEIDKLHLTANLALRNKDFAAYMSHFNANLKYKQLNGNTINKIKLAEDTKKYFDRISNYKRLSFSFENDLFIKKISQKSTVAIRVFIFFSKKWTVDREGIYK